MKLLLVGDIAPRHESIPVFAAGDTQTLFGGVLPLFREHDFSFANLECAITESDTAIRKIGPPLKAHPHTAAILKEVGVTCCGVSNNHSFDYGIRGMRDTFAALDAAGIHHTGFGENAEDARQDYHFRKGGESVALIAVCEHEYSYALEDRAGTRAFDPYDTMADIRRAKAENTRVIVLYHGGKEFCKYPSPRVRKLCRAMIDNGADVVLCQHSHCIATYEAYNGGHILHGQGNFHFAKLGMDESWYSSLSVSYDTESGEITFLPVALDGVSLHVAEGEEADTIMNAFYARNEELADGRWRERWHAFCESNRTAYQQAVKDAYTDADQDKNQVFAHYLDCEAHTDVWRELFPTYNHTNEI